MKRCSTCNRTYTDPNLSYCIEDGTPLTTVEVEDESTLVSQRDRQNTADEDLNAVSYRPPGAYVPPGTQVRRRRIWPWVLGIVGAFVLGIVAITIAAVLLAPRFMRSAQNQRTSTAPAPSNTNQPENVNQPENANVTAPPANINANSNSAANVNANVDSPPPADHDQVLAQLRDLENDWTVANLNADKKTLDRVLADDYVGPTPDGGLQSKADYIRTARRDTNVQKWEFDDLKLKLAGDRATLSGKITYVIDDRDVVFDFTDKFVWRDGRWQATGSEVKERE